MNYTDSYSPFLALTFFSDQSRIVYTNYPKEIVEERDNLLLTKFSETGIRIQDYLKFPEIINERVTKVINGDYVHIFLDNDTNPLYICSWKAERVEKENRIFDEYTQGYWPELVGYRRIN